MFNLKSFFLAVVDFYDTRRDTFILLFITSLFDFPVGDATVTPNHGLTCRYAFKCHRKSEGGKDIVYAVNAIAFHPV